MTIARWMAFVVASLGATGVAAQGLSIGLLRGIGHVDHCSCTLYVGGDPDKPLLESEFQGPAHSAWLNVGGRDARFVLESSTEPEKLSDGASFTRHYIADDIRVIVRYRVTDVCKTNTECDGYGVIGAITVKSPNGVSSVRGQGVCGC
jgi:hypothetical protein